MKMETKAMLSVIVLFGLMLSSCNKNNTEFVSRRHSIPEGMEEIKVKEEELKAKEKEEEKRKKAEAEAQTKKEERKTKGIKKATDSSSNISSSSGPNQSLNPRSSSSSSSSNGLPPSRQYSTGKGVGDTDADGRGRGVFSSSSSSSDGSSSSLINSPPSAPPLIELQKCSTIRLHTDGKTYCSYKTENSSKFALVASKHKSLWWSFPINYFNELPVGSLYIRVGKIIDKANKIHVEIIRKKEGDTRNTTIREAKFIRLKPNDNSNDEWTPDSDGFRAVT